MKLSLSFPILLTARPKGSKKDRDLHLVSRTEYEIPEYSVSEGQIAYRMDTTPPSAEWGSKNSDILRFADRLYRPIGEVADCVESYYSMPFYARMSAMFADQGLNAHFEGLLRLQQSLGIRSRKTWPDPIDYEDSRNITVFEEVLPTLEDVNSAELAEAMASVERAARGLVLFSGKLWCETAAPRHVVQLEEWHSSPFFFVRAVPDFVDEFPKFHYAVASRCFAVSDNASSTEYAEELRAFPPKKKKEVATKLYSGIVALEAEEPYDGYTEQVRRISRELAYASVVTAHSKPNLAERLSSDKLELVSVAKAALLNENYVLDRRFDMSESCRDLLSIWRELGRPKLEYCLDWKAMDLLDTYLEKTLDAWEPILVPNGSQGIKL